MQHARRGANEVGLESGSLDAVALEEAGASRFQERIPRRQSNPRQMVGGQVGRDG